MSTTKRKFRKLFKLKVVLASWKDNETLESLANKYNLTPIQISICRGLAMKNLWNVFSPESFHVKESDINTHIIYAQLGQLKVENGFL